ncbi:MAG: hypothetical protein K2H53_05660, partial [Clostridia bacterium]|nr:hypothetical protein [Clostridia bacterium]
YKKNIFIMRNGELEDYYIKETLEEECSNISGKGIIAYKIAELSQINGIDKYIRIDEYKDILSHIIGKRRIKGYKSLNRKCYKRIKKEG